MSKKLITIASLAWMAGVVETRGKIQRVDSPLRKNVMLRLRVQSRHIPLVERLATYTGVLLTYHAEKTLTVRNRKSCADHCPEPHVHVEGAELPRMACWAVSGAGAAIVLANLQPYFVDDERITKFVDDVVANLPHHGRGFAAVKSSADRLRTLGWKIPDGVLPAPPEASPDWELPAELDGAAA